MSVDVLARLDNCYNAFDAHAIRKYINTLEVKIEELKSNTEEINDCAEAQASDLLRVIDRHDRLVKYLIDIYQCPPTKTAETCKGKGDCYNCWGEWAELALPDSTEAKDAV